MLPVYASRTSRRRASSSSILHSFSWASLLHRALTYTTTIPHLYFAAPMHNVSSLFSLSVPLCSPLHRHIQRPFLAYPAIYITTPFVLRTFFIPVYSVPTFCHPPP